MRIFIDTSAFYALLDRDDANHQKAKEVWADLLRADHSLITSNYVLVETFALLQSRLGMEAGEKDKRGRFYLLTKRSASDFFSTCRGQRDWH